MTDVTDRLFNAIWASELEEARIAMSLGANIHIQDEQGFSALSVAVLVGLSMVELLLELGADPNYPNENGLTPLVSATALGDLPIAQMLLDSGAKLQYLCEGARNTSLHDSVESGNYEMASLVAHYATDNDLNSPNSSGFTPMMIAVALGNQKMQEMLLHAGTDPNVEAR